MKGFITLFMVLAMFAIVAEVRAQDRFVFQVDPSCLVMTPDATYLQLLNRDCIRWVSAVEGGGPEKIMLYKGFIYGPLGGESLRLEVIRGLRSIGCDTLDLGDVDRSVYDLVRYFSEKHEYDGGVAVGYDPQSKSIGFRTTMEGAIVKVEAERNLLFLTKDYNMVKVISADQMFNDRSVAYRSFYGSHEGLRAKLDVVYFPLSNEAILLAPAEYLKQYPSSGTVVRGQ